MSTIVVGDLHGRVEVVEKVLKFAGNTLDVVFVGDYLDSFNRSYEDQIRTLQLVIGATHDDPKRFTALKGNHELSYLDENMRCSGYSLHTHNMVKHLDMLALKDYVWVNGILISHAGISKTLLEYLDIDYDTYLREQNFNQIGRVRGGTWPCGGLYWCDWNFEFEPLEFPQIVGHTRGRGIRQNCNSYCIDCLEDEDSAVLFIEDNGEIEVIPEEEL